MNILSRGSMYPHHKRPIMHHVKYQICGYFLHYKMNKFENLSFLLILSDNYDFYY